MAVNSAKVREGDKLVAEADKCLKTGWLKWSPDFDGAAHALDKAALCYRNAKAYAKARDSYERSADVYYRNHAIFHSGRALENAANICKDMKDLNLAAEFLERASGRYHESGHGDTAGQVLSKAAKLVDASNPRKAANYYLATADLHEIEDKHRESANAVRSAVNMWARAKDYEKLLESLERLKQLYQQLQVYKHLHHVAAIEVLVHLHGGNSLAASDTLSAANGIPGFAESDEAPVLEKMIDAYRDDDTDALQKCCDNPVFTSMDNEIAKLARDLKLKQQGYALESDTFTPSQSTAPPPTKPQTEAPKPTSMKPQSVGEMKSELFGGSDGTGGGARRGTKHRVEDSEDDHRTPFSEYSGRDDESSRYSEAGSEVTVESRLEEGGQGMEGLGEGDEEEKSEEESEDNPYGGLLT